ncbi:MAG: hypothetical protein MJ137_08635 [Clostridia bacterium]|nr:hypothetical protein [Clostridia bacterium]
MLMLYSCTGNAQDTEQNTSEITVPESSEAPESVLLLASEGKSDYKIVFPVSGGDYISAAESLKSRLSNSFGINIPTSADYVLPGKNPQEKEILIGPCDREESRTVNSELKNGEYAVKVVGSKLVICGNGTEALNNALMLFCRNLSLTDNKITVSSKDDIVFKRTFPVESFTIGGRPLSDYKIVVPKGSGTARLFAKLIAARIATRTGIELEITDENHVPDSCEIRFGNFAELPELEKNTFKVFVTGNVMTAYSSDIGGLFDAYFHLFDVIFGAKEKTISIPDGYVFSDKSTQESYEKAADGNIRVLYHNVLGYGTDTPIYSRADIAYDIYCELDPDIICFEEAGSLFRSGASSFYSNLKKNNLAEICFSSEGGLGNPIYYRNDRFELLDSGYGKSRNGDKGTTYAVFKRKSDGKIFAVTNSHFAANSNAQNNPELGNKYRTQDAETAVSILEKIKAKYPGITVIMGGDYNSAKNSDPINVIDKSGAVHVRTQLSLWSNVPSPHHSYPVINKNISDYDMYSGSLSGGSSSIDHIYFYGTDLKPVSYTVVTSIVALTTSDHTIHFADFSAG